jgi:hypothetical protein
MKIMLSEINQTEKDKYVMYSFKCGIQILKINMNVVGEIFGKGKEIFGKGKGVGMRGVGAKRG